MKRTTVAVLAAVLAPAVALYGWGQKGHRIVADVAQERLTEVTKRNVQSLIGKSLRASGSTLGGYRSGMRVRRWDDGLRTYWI